MAKVAGQTLWDFCEDLVEQRAGYVWGGRGKVYTKQEADFLFKNYKTSTYDKKYYYTTSMERWQNKIVVDCSGMIQAFRIKHFDGKDATAQGLYEQCTKKGTIDTLPKNLRGVLLFKQYSGKMGHVGVYGGDGTTIESLNSTKGVVLLDPMNTKSWSHWGIPDWLEPTEIKSNKPTTIPQTTVSKTTDLYKVAHCTWLNTRKGPGVKYDVVKAIKKNTIVTVYEKKDNWCKIEKNANVWVSANYLEKLPKYKISHCVALNVRNKPDTKGKVVRRLKAGDIVHCYEIATTGWLKISGDDEYISFKYVKQI